LADPSELYGRISTRLDLNDSSYLDDFEIGQLCEESYFDLWDFLIAQLGPEGPWSRINIATVAGLDSVTVPSGIYRILRLEFAAPGSTLYLPASSLNLASDPIDAQPRSWADARSFRYFARRGVRVDDATRIAASGYGFAPWKFYFSPIPNAVYSLRLYYVPPPNILVDGSGVYTTFPDDYPEYVVADVCAKLMDKQEADSAPFVAERERIKARIERYSTPHSMTGPKLISNMRQYGDDGGVSIEDDWRRRR
jgi:hypothetical protein